MGLQGAIDPHTPIGQGWLRASHRKLDKKLSKPNRPYHTHDQKQPLKKGQVVALMGESGRATGPNLHFEVLHDGRRVNPVNFIRESSK